MYYTSTHNTVHTLHNPCIIVYKWSKGLQYKFPLIMQTKIHRSCDKGGQPTLINVVEIHQRSYSKTKQNDRAKDSKRMSP